MLKQSAEKIDTCCEPVTTRAPMAAAHVGKRGGRVMLMLLDGVPVRIGVSLVGVQWASRALAAVSPP